MGQASPIIGEPIASEIRRVVDRARETGSILSIADIAVDMLQTFPGTGLTVEHLANEVMIRAAAAGVPVEIGKPHSRGSAEHVGTHTDHAVRVI
jgi:hypothetical protein